MILKNKTTNKKLNLSIKYRSKNLLTKLTQRQHHSKLNKRKNKIHQHQQTLLTHNQNFKYKSQTLVTIIKLRFKKRLKFNQNPTHKNQRYIFLV